MLKKETGLELQHNRVSMPSIGEGSKTEVLDIFWKFEGRGDVRSWWKVRVMGRREK